MLFYGAQNKSIPKLGTDCFQKDNMPTEPIDALETVFTNKTISKPAPSISKFTINNQKVTDNIQLKAEEKYNAEVLLKELSKNIGSSQVKYRWRIMERRCQIKKRVEIKKMKRMKCRV